MMRNRLIVIVIVFSFFIVNVGSLLIHQAFNSLIFGFEFINFIGFRLSYALVLDLGIWIMMASTIILAVFIIIFLINEY